MKISNNYSYRPIQFAGKIPLNQYKGPTLKLTEDDLNKIAKLQEAISHFEIERYNLRKYMDSPNFLAARIYYYTEKLGQLDFQISELRDAIREIKINRFNQQKSSLK